MRGGVPLEEGAGSFEARGDRRPNVDFKPHMRPAGFFCEDMYPAK